MTILRKNHLLADHVGEDVHLSIVGRDGVTSTTGGLFWNNALSRWQVGARAFSDDDVVGFNWKDGAFAVMVKE